MNIIWAILIFSLVVIFHEFGHYTFAKRAGIKVNEFSLGMGPRLFSFNAAGTKWSVKLLPLGGSCMMEGEDENSSDENAFGKKSVWARISVVFGGPLFNFILAFILSLFVIGIAGYDPARVTTVTANSPASEAGIQEGDLITSFDGHHITLGRELANYFQMNSLSGRKIPVTYKRDGNSMKTVMTPVERKVYLLGFSYTADANAAIKGAEIGDITDESPLKEAKLADGSSSEGLGNELVKKGDIITAVNDTSIDSGSALQSYFNENPLDGGTVKLSLLRTSGGTDRTWDITVTPSYQGTTYYLGMGYNLSREKTDFIGTIGWSLNEVKYWIVSTIQGLKMMITGRVSTKDIAGPVGIVQMIGNTYEQSKSAGLLYIFLNMANISILISANLGVINLLPLPALDGGRLVFLFIEAIRRKPVDQEKEGMVHLIGFAALMVLMVFVFYNDIMRLIG